ncbi:hypothetical protein ILYODFUR_008154 [Ilyodon furcidens]|uniref:Uncharacterized protein n=1 Tax=Ilyodon furcidens TaxID=33524 RepID=A0ABV0TSY4_9TELE
MAFLGIFKYYFKAGPNLTSLLLREEIFHIFPDLIPFPCTSGTDLVWKARKQPKNDMIEVKSALKLIQLHKRQKQMFLRGNKKQRQTRRGERRAKEKGLMNFF